MENGVNRWLYIVAFLGIVSSCNKEDTPSLPEVVTLSTNRITTTSVELVASIAKNGGAPVMESGVCWSTTTQPTLEKADRTSDGSVAGAFTSHVTNLLPGTQYFVRAYAKNAAGTAYGNEITFTTINAALSKIATSGVSDITATTARVSGNVTYDGGDVETIRGICWGMQEHPTVSDSKTINGSGMGSFTGDITGLTPGTTYYVRAYATNSIGTGYGEELNFTALALQPELTTAEITVITSLTAITGGTITNDGGGIITDRGVCWSLNANPTISDSKKSSGTGSGNFTAALTGLGSSTSYFVRAYATNSAGTAYGNELHFTTAPPSETIQDIDGNVYYMVTVGTQTWMAQNLKTTFYSDGSPLLDGTDQTVWTSTTSGAYAIYDDLSANNDVYGKLYNSYAAHSAKKLCPAGTHLPSVAEWEILINFGGGTAVAGDKFKESGAAHWGSGNTGTDNYDFTALPAGLRSGNGTYDWMGTYTGYWTTESVGLTLIYLTYELPNMFIKPDNSNAGLSVRCLAD